MSEESAQSADGTVRVSLAFALQAPTPQVLLDWMIQQLEEHGYSVRPPNDSWETPAQFMQRLGICYETFRRALKKDGRPHVVVRRERGGAGRIREICSNADFDAFCLRGKTLKRERTP